MPAAVAATSAGTSILGGYLGSRAAKRAAEVQRQEAITQATQLRDVQGREANALEGEAGYAGGLLMDQTAAARGELRGATAEGQREIRGGAESANKLLSPYTELGAEGATNLREWMAGPGKTEFTADMMEQYDPGFRFRLDMAQQAAEKGAAARGGVLGGGFAKALAAQQQGLASSEFGAAHDRFMRQQESRYNRLSGMTQIGQRAAETASGNLTRSAELAAGMGTRGAEVGGEWDIAGRKQAGQWNIGAQSEIYNNALNTQKTMADLMTGGAAAKAGGIVGSANAWGGALSGIAQAGQNYMMQKQAEEDADAYGGYWRNPATQPSRAGRW